MRVAARPRPRRRFSALARALAAAALLLLAAVVALRLRAPQEQAGPPPAADEAARLSAHMRARAQLLRRDGARLVFIITTQARGICAQGSATPRKALTGDRFGTVTRRRHATQHARWLPLRASCCRQRSAPGAAPARRPALRL
jgi:hypothetical protein